VLVVILYTYEFFPAQKYIIRTHTHTQPYTFIRSQICHLIRTSIYLIRRKARAYYTYIILILTMQHFNRKMTTLAALAKTNTFTSSSSALLMKNRINNTKIFRNNCSDFNKFNNSNYNNTRLFSTNVHSQKAPTAASISEEISLEEEEEELTDMMKPRLIVEQLDKNIVGQDDAKRAVAVALRNRWRRQQLDEDLRREVTPKNILMIGPTGCGKTEIARRLALLADAPFLKVEATKFTEVGFHGRDVDMIIRDLLDNGIHLAKKRLTDALHERIRKEVKEEIITIMYNTKSRTGSTSSSVSPDSASSSKGKIYSKEKSSANDKATKEQLGTLYDDGSLDEVVISVTINQKLNIDPNNNNPQEVMKNMMAALNSAQGAGMGDKKRKEKLKVSEAKSIMYDQKLQVALDEEDVTKFAIEDVEQNGIVFIDEIDKICSSGDYRGADASAEGVQKDLLPLIEGSTISTKHGNVNTDHILFIASGAFHQCKPSDLLPELQGRLPIRVELKGLDENDLYRILTEPVTNIIVQNKALIGTEGVDLDIDDDAIKEIARLAAEVNRSVENIGARRLHTCMERIIEEISFDAADMDDGTVIKVDVPKVQERLGEMVEKVDLSKFIL
jgi:ATP-dependent HslUV protease ATP-binding subunit HslU